MIVTRDDMQAEFSNVEGKVCTIEGKLASIEAKLNSMEVKFSGMGGEFSEMQEKWSSLLEERLQDMDDKLVHFQGRIDSQATSLFSIRDDVGASKVEIDSKIDLLESAVRLRIQEASMDIEEKLAEAVSSTVQRVHINTFDGLRFQVENTIGEVRLLKERADKAARCAKMWDQQKCDAFFKGRDRLLFERCFSMWAAYKSQSAVKKERTRMIMTCSLGQIFSFWYRNTVHGKNAQAFQRLRIEFKESMAMVEAKCTQQLDVHCDSVRQAISQVVEKSNGRCNSLSETLQLVRDEVRGHVERHTAKHAELRQAITTVERGQMAAIEQTGHLRKQFDTVMGKTSKPGTCDGFTSTHLMADPEDLIAEIMRLKCTGNK